MSRPFLWGEKLFSFGFVISSIPFILPFRYFPNGDFFSDAAALGVAFLALIFAFRRFHFGYESLLLVAVSIFILCSGFVMRSYYYDVWFLPACAVIFFSFVLAGVGALDSKLKARFSLGLQSGILFGGAVSILIGLAQYTGVAASFGGTFIYSAGKVYGNLAQRNLYSTYLLIFSCVLCAVAVRHVVKDWLVLGGLALAAFLLTVAGSRMVLLDVFLVVAVLAWLYRVRRGDQQLERFSFLFLSFSIILVVLQFVFISGGMSGASRITAVGDAPRVGEWLKGLQILMDNPLGVGFGNYAKASFVYQLGEEGGSQITWSHAHNIVIQFLVEFGLLAVPLLLAGVLLGGRLLYRALGSDLDRVCFAICLIFLVVHSFLEYPLWYMNFLLLFVSFIGVTNTEARVGYKANSIRFGAGVALIVLVMVSYDYIRTLDYRNADREARVNVERMTDLLSVSLNPLLAWSADKLLIEYLIPDGGPEAGFKLCQSIFMAEREPLYPYLERVALMALADGKFDLASSVLKSRYAVYSRLPDTYLKARIRFHWQNWADDFIEKIDADRKAGFPGVDYYRLEIPDECLK